MKIFGWVQNKLRRKEGSQTRNSVSSTRYNLKEVCKEEFDDWPQGLLAIGTFGNANLKRCNVQENQSSCKDHQLDITPEEVEELQKDLNLLMHSKFPLESFSAEEFEGHDFPLENFLKLPCQDEAGSIGEKLSNDSEKKERTLQRSTSLVLGREKEIRLDNTNNAIGKKSLSFLLKKIFLCRHVFQPTPTLRNSLLESRMEKLLRAIIHKKIYPHGSTQKPSKPTAKRFLENKQISNTTDSGEDEIQEGTIRDGSKWVKTDSEFIVLEI